MARFFVNFTVLNDKTFNVRAREFLQTTDLQFLDANISYPVNETMISKVIHSPFSFSHRLVKTAKNQWHMVEHAQKGRGSFGEVCASTCIITVNGNSVAFQKVKHVVKIQQVTADMPHDALLELAQKEANYQTQHDVNVYAVVDAGDKIITVLDDCGVSLDKIFSQLNQRHDFKYRLEIAKRLASELELLENNDLVHRDLKPANICYKLLEDNKGFLIIFIDFGLCQDTVVAQNNIPAGTLAYMAPELFHRKPASSASDGYAMAAVYGELFGATDVLKLKLQSRYAQKASFDFTGMFQTYDASRADITLLHDLKKLFRKLSDPDPLQRPTTRMQTKFFATVSERLELYNYYQPKKTSSMQDLSNLLQPLIGLDGVDAPTHNPLISTLRVRSQDLLQPLLHHKSHYDLALALTQQNRTADFRNQDNPFAGLIQRIEEIKQETAILHNTTQELKRFTEALSNLNKWQGSNSTGIKKILTILSLQSPLLEKLHQIKTLSQKKTKADCFNWSSRISLFGKGRHANMDTLYQKLAAIEVVAGKDETSYVALDAIVEFINKNNFVHARDPKPEITAMPAQSLK